MLKTDCMDLVKEGILIIHEEGLKDVHVPSHAAVREIEDAALPGHIVLQYDDAIFLQAISAPGKKRKKVFIGQVPYR